MLLLAAIWGASFLSTALVLRELGYLSTVALRLFGAAVVLWAVVLIRGLPVPRDLRIWGAFAVMGLLNNAVPFTLITWAQQHIPTGLTGILNASTAIFGVLMAALVFADERLSRRKLTGITLGFAGSAMVIGPSALTQFDPTSLAQLAMLASSVSYGLAGSWARARLGGLRPQVAAAGMLSMSTLMMIPVALSIEGIPDLSLAAPSWMALLYLSVFATAGAYLLYYRVLAIAGAGNLMLVTPLLTPFAILLGALVLGEDLPPRAYAGFVLLAAGLLAIDGRVLRLAERKRNRV
ncbi:DMT family transporter [Thalassovita aquimarina]|uniref:DMT family transporter n=1 Tax=Thalassovita aquimarina TaxID=2785917 RepID=A0ABS5HLF1_9RHOB|nr:DMT family transporter [Thalassovita aquimarina]MBR9649800.1 DMT family transporter [Thalassovita aquimarina]